MATSYTEEFRRDAVRIAVIGGGVFGCQCAVELSSLGHVDIFERNDEILTEASLKNQWRHHSGFHYPLTQQITCVAPIVALIFQSDGFDPCHRDLLRIIRNPIESQPAEITQLVLTQPLRG